MAAATRPVVVGAGWSGLACAIELVRRGRPPIVLDAAPQAGGRARAVRHTWNDATAHALDNGQHLLLGAYAQTLALMSTVGVDADRALQRLGFALAYPDGWRLGAARLPAPWHLAGGLFAARGLSLAQRVSLAGWVAQQATRGWRIAGDPPAEALFTQLAPVIVRRLWRPLCLAALNVELRDASAQVLLNVLRDALAGSARDADLLVPRADLSALLPIAAVHWLQSRGADVRLQCPVHALQAAPRDPGGAGARYRVQVHGASIATGEIVLALPPDRAAALLGPLDPVLQAAVGQLQALRFAPIATTYVRHAPGTRLAHTLWPLLDDASAGHHGQWAFDRGALDPALDGIISIVVSGDGPHRDLAREELGARNARQLSHVFGLPECLEHYTLVEKRATIVPCPGLVRPPARLPLAGVFLAGDAADSRYPSTIEGSVCAGIAAATALCES